MHDPYRDLAAKVFSGAVRDYWMAKKKELGVSKIKGNETPELVISDIRDWMDPRGVRAENFNMWANLLGMAPANVREWLGGVWDRLDNMEKEDFYYKNVKGNRAVKGLSRVLT